ncbi:MAG TPA: DUF952 domain-containing protein [Hyphomicrobiaceae bacterium]|nr:DUF952 domain-containing protein [Hyphomicrobiaceae bacterium]
MPRLVFKVVGQGEWSAARKIGRYEGSRDDRRDGFIHLSMPDQLAGTLERHFAGLPDLVLVAVDTGRLAGALRLEASRSGALYPHLYGALDLAAVVWEKPLTLGPDGQHLVPEETT